MLFPGRFMKFSIRLCSLATLAGLLIVFAAASGTVRAQDALPADVQSDVLKLEIFEAARRDLHKDVLILAEKMRKTGQPLVPEIQYLEGKAFYGLGALPMARRSLAAYLKDVGRQGKDYEDAVRLYVKVKAEIDDKARALRETSALRADYESTRASWLAEKERIAQWKKRAVVFGGPDDDSASAIVRGADGGIVVAGAFHVRKTQDDKAVDAALPWVTAFNVDGKRIWHRPLGSASDAGSLRSVTAIPGKGYLFGGVQKGFQIAAMTDRLGNLVSNGEGDPWVMAFAPSAGEGGVARLLNDGDIIAIGAEEIGKDDQTGKANARLPVAVRLSPKGKVLGKYVLARGGQARWYDVKDALVLDSGDILIAGEIRAADGDSSSAEGYVTRIKVTGEEVWTARLAPTRGGGTTVTALAADKEAIYAVGRDGADLAYVKYASGGKLLWRHSRAALAMPDAFARFCAVADPATKLAAAYRNASTRDRKNAASDPLSDLADVRAFACRGARGFAAATAITRYAGGFLILGVAGRDGSPVTRITATAIDPDGAVSWETIHGDGPVNVATGALAAGDGGFVVAGITNNWGRDVLLFKLDRNGALAPFAALGPPAKPAALKKAPATAVPKEAPTATTSDAEDPEVEKSAPAPETGADVKSPDTGKTPAPPKEENRAGGPAGGEPSYDLFDLLGGIFSGSPDSDKKPDRE